MMPELQIHSTEKVRDTTLDDENASQHMTSVLVMALSNQPVCSSDCAEAFASDRGDDQSCYLCDKQTGSISAVTMVKYEYS